MKEYYLDNAATTKMVDGAIDEATAFLRDNFYNPSAVYDKSISVKRKVEAARFEIMSILGSDDGNLIFTGSATEANNMAIFSNRQIAGKRFLFGSGEHPSVLECAKQLQSRGADVVFLPLDKTGRIDIEKYKLYLSENVAFISIQHVSNETGAINDIEKLCKMAKKVNNKVIFHSDGVQAFLKLDYSVDQLGVDYYTISAHKICGPKGIGALYVKKGVKVNPLIFGGGQESGLRSGTENVFNIIGFAAAACALEKDRETNSKKVAAMRNELLKEFDKNNIKYEINGGTEFKVDNIMSISFGKDVRGETLLHALEKRGVYVSTGSACSANKHFNTTLESMSMPKEQILSSIRISLSPYMLFDAKEIAKIIKEELEKLEGKNYGKMFTY